MGFITWASGVLIGVILVWAVVINSQENNCDKYKMLTGKETFWQYGECWEFIGKGKYRIVSKDEINEVLSND